MKRLLVTIHTPTFGGPHNQILRMYQPLQQMGWETIVLLPEEAGNGYDRLTEAGIPCRRMPLHRLRATVDPRQHLTLLRNFRHEVAQIRQIIHAEQIDLVQVCGLLSVQGALAARAEGIPIVWQLLSNFSPYALRLLVTPLVTQMADVIMTTGMQVAKQHPGLLRAKERIIPFIPPVDTTNFRPDPTRRRAARAELGVADDTILIGTVGNFSRQKGHEYLVATAAVTRATHPQTAFRVLGAQTSANTAYYDKAVKQKAAALGLTEDGYLAFFDPGNRVAELLPAFDLFLLTSRAEGIPTAALEAMACAIPVVATNVGAISEVIEDGVTGLLVNQLATTQLAAAVDRLLTNPTLRQTMAHNAREAIVMHYDLQRCTEVHRQAYEQALHAAYHHQAKRTVYLQAERP